MCGSPQGWVNTPQLFQNRMLTEILEPISLFGEKGTGICQWIDDTLLYSTDVPSYLAALTKFLRQMILKGRRLNVKKCSFIGTEMSWCGRLISNKGWRYSDKYFNKLLKMPRPSFQHELAQMLYLCNWLSPCVPKLSELRGSFDGLVNLQASAKLLRKKNEPVEWTTPAIEAWNSLLSALNTASKRFLQMYDPYKPLCLFTDASDNFWGLMLTHCSNSDPSKLEDQTPIDSQEHQPLFFLSGKFASNQLSWHVSQKKSIRCCIVSRGYPL